MAKGFSLSRNHANLNGGAIYLEGATLTLLNSTLSNNDCNANGGAINSNTGATLKLLNSTLSGNSAVNHGGGLFANSSTNTLINSTITDNTANTDADPTGDGGGIRRGLGGTTVVEIGNTIIAGNDDPAPTILNRHFDVSGEFTTLGHNLIGKSAGSTGFVDGVSGDQVGTGAAPVDPLLDPLSNNGGNTRTHALGAASPAADAGDNTLLDDPAWPAGPPANDQRDSARISGVRIDIGSFEIVSATTALTFAQWVANAGLTGGDALEDSTPFGDGIANLLKYAFNLDGSKADAQVLVPGTGISGLPAVTSTPSGTDIVLTIEYLRRIGGEAQYTPVKSGDLASWLPLAGTENVVAIDAEWERVTISETFDRATVDRQFGAVEVDLNCP